jgi:hypothetical protein
VLGTSIGRSKATSASSLLQWDLIRFRSSLTSAHGLAALQSPALNRSSHRSKPSQLRHQARSDRLQAPNYSAPPKKQSSSPQLRIRSVRNLQRTTKISTSDSIQSVSSVSVCLSSDPLGLCPARLRQLYGSQLHGSVRSLGKPSRPGTVHQA